MVKIIKPGKIRYEETCYKCGCEFSFEAEDVTRIINYDNHGCRCSDWYHIDCPFCKANLDVVSFDFREDEIIKMKKGE